MKVICIFFLFFIAYVYSQATLVQFSHTKLTTSTKGQFRVRRTKAKLVNTNRIVGGSIKSVSVTKVNGETSLDGVRFAAFAVNPLLGLGGVAPTASSAYFTKDVDVNNDTASGNGVNFEVNKASNFVALRFFSFEEIDPSNNNAIVKTIRFNSLDWSVVNSSATNTDADVDLPYVTLHATTNNIVIQIAFIATANLIKITYPGLTGGPIVPPKGMEVIFAADLTNYNYTSTTSYLRLVTFTATGSAQRQTNVTSPNPDITNKHSFITSVSNGVPANIRFDQRATFNGQRVFNLAPNVSVSTDVSGVFNGTDVSVQLSSFFGANSQLTRTDVPFEPNAKGVVVYDPTLSFGTDPTTVSSTQSYVSTLTISIALLFLTVLISLF